MLLKSKEHRIDDTVRLRSTLGHTPNKCALHISSGNAEMATSGDLILSLILCAPDRTARPNYEVNVARNTHQATLPNLARRMSLYAHLISCCRPQGISCVNGNRLCFRHHEENKYIFHIEQ